MSVWVSSYPILVLHLKSGQQLQCYLEEPFSLIVRITRLFQANNLSCGNTAQLDADASNHIIRVLRSKVDSPVILFNGDGFDYLCRTQDTNAKKTTVLIESKSEVNNESNLSITLIQGLSRNDRMEASIQKSVELGVNKVIPALCQRSNTKISPAQQVKKLAYWRKITISACEQSGRCDIPEIKTIKSLNNIQAELDPTALKIILDPDADHSLKDIDLKKRSVEIFIGPEGGINSEELQQLAAMGFNNIRFGPRILRTETAGPAVISALQVLWGDC